MSLYSIRITKMAPGAENIQREHHENDEGNL